MSNRFRSLTSKNSSLKNQFSFESILLHRNLIQFFINARIELDYHHRLQLISRDGKIFPRPIRNRFLFILLSTVYRPTYSFLLRDKLRRTTKIQLFCCKGPLKHPNGLDNFILIYRSSLHHAFLFLIPLLLFLNRTSFSWCKRLARQNLTRIRENSPLVFSTSGNDDNYRANDREKASSCRRPQVESGLTVCELVTQEFWNIYPMPDRCST